MARRRARKSPGLKEIDLKPLLKNILIEIPDLILSGDALKTAGQRFRFALAKEASQDAADEQFDHIILTVIDMSGAEERVMIERSFDLQEFDGIPFVKKGEYFTAGSLGDLDNFCQACAAFISANRDDSLKPPRREHDDDSDRRDHRRRPRDSHSRSRRPSSDRSDRPPRRGRPRSPRQHHKSE